MIAEIFPANIHLSTLGVSVSIGLMRFGEAGPPARVAVNSSQLASLAELPKIKKYAIYESLTEDNIEPYLQVSCYPITVKAEDDMVNYEILLLGLLINIFC